METINDKGTATMKLAVLDSNRTDHWAEVHKAGCADLNQRFRRGGRKGDGAWELEASTYEAAAEDIACDFIEDEVGSRLADFVNGHIHWAPCVELEHRKEA